jgi:UPF0755 protein
MPRHRRNITTSSKPTMRARSAHAQARKKFVQYDTTPIRPKKSKAPKIIAIAVIVLIVILIALFLIIPNVFAQSNKGSLPATTSATVVIESGDTARDVAKKFESMNLVANADKFVEELERSGALKSLIPGSYTFKGQTDTKHITQRLKTGDSDDVPTVTVVEGYTLKATASAIDDASDGQISYDDFISATSDASKYASDYDFLKEVGTNSLEGFLLPKTYDIGTSDTAETMIEKMLDQFKTEAMALDYSYPKKNNLSVYDAVKLASVVQKESSGDIQPRVAGIFYNRLRSDSPYLQSDATTAYSVGHNPTGEEVHADDPYSTYTNPGLPPTPICNPSIDALESVCNPEENNYRYFYSYDDGTYAFSETYEEHQAAIARDTQQ